MERVLIVIAGLAGFAGVATGAAASHLTANDPHAHDLLDIASRYLLIHAAALIGVSAALGHSRLGWARTFGLVAGSLFAIGGSFFSGGIIAQVATGRHTLDAVIPVGGISLMLGWLALAIFGAGLGRGQRG